jgi:hypothetical protein
MVMLRGSVEASTGSQGPELEHPDVPEPPPSYETHSIESVTQLLRLLRGAAAASETIEWYRGHSSAEYKLLLHSPGSHVMSALR